MSDKDEWASAEKATDELMKEFEETAERSLDSDDPWDVTIGLLQLARSTGYDCHFTLLALRQVIRLVFAASIQWCLLRYFGYSLLTINPYGSQPWLCNMGRDFMNCEGENAGPDCIGPGGTRFRPDNLFSSYGTWSSRMFLRDGLLSVFSGDAEMTKLIGERIDPGEYGLEDSFVRYLALLLFAIQIQAELRAIIDSTVLVSWLPCTDEPWLQLDNDGETFDDVKFVHGGMPWYYKIIAYLIIFVRFFIMLFTGILGVRFLLDTAAIQDLIFNSLALAFLFDLDTLIQGAWSTKEPHQVMEKLEPISTDRNHWFTIAKDGCHKYCPVPVEGLVAILLVIIWSYYVFQQHCVENALGGLVSAEVHAVEYGSYTILPWFWEFTTTAQWCPPAALTTLFPNCTR